MRLVSLPAFSSCFSGFGDNLKLTLGETKLQGTETVPSNARSHTCLLSGVYIGNVKVLVRAQFGMDSSKEIAMKLAVRAEDASVAEAIHEIVANG